MPQVYATPGVYIEEKSAFPTSAVAVATAVPAFIGYTEKAIRNNKTILNKPTRITSLNEYHDFFGEGPKIKFEIDKGDDGEPFKLEVKQETNYYMYNALRLFFANGGSTCYIISVGLYDYSKGVEAPVLNPQENDKGIKTLLKEMEPTMVVIPDAVLLDEADCNSLQQNMLMHCGVDMPSRRVALLDVYNGYLPRTRDEHDVIEKFRTGIGNNHLQWSAAYYPWVESTVVPVTEVSLDSISNLGYLKTMLSDSLSKADADKKKTDALNLLLVGIDEITNPPDVSPTTTDAVDKANKSAAQAAEAAAAAKAAAAIPAAKAANAMAEASNANAALYAANAALKAADKAAKAATIAAEKAKAALAQNPEAADADKQAQEAKKSADDAQKAADKAKKEADAAAKKAADLEQKATEAAEKAADTDAIAAAATAAAAASASAAAIAAAATQIGDASEERLTALHNAMYTSIPLYKTIVSEVRSKMNILPPSAAMAGIISMVDGTVGVAKSPANVSMGSVVKPTVNITHKDQEDLNVPLDGKAVNAIRSFPGKGVLVWGARTLDGNSQDWRYLSVRRAVIMIEQSLKIASEGYVFEPNVSNTWVTVKGMMTNFLTDQWKRGVLAGAVPEDAFSVDIGLGVTMTPTDILDGFMNITVKLAVVRPAEFIVITFQQQMQKS